jgi:hypothetical protein
VLRVSAADKLHNARAILADHRQAGDAVFDRFSVPMDGTLACDLHHVVEELLRATGSDRYTALPVHTPAGVSLLPSR